jgi:choline dehydrogenase-like flavoprotein
MKKIAIIGAGLSGLATAYKLIQNHHKGPILVIESGKENFSFTKQRLNKQSNFTNQKHKKQLQEEFIVNQWEGDRHYLDRLRFRRIGGSANYWGSESLIAQKRDLERVSPYGSWPITYEELYLYYEEVANNFGFKMDLFKEQFISNNLTLSYWQYLENIQYIKEKILLTLNKSSNVKLLKNTTLIEFVGNTKSVTKIIVNSEISDHEEIEVDILILAAGAIENASLLLNSQYIKTTVNAVTFDNIGRFFSELPHGYIASLYCSNYKMVDSLLYDRALDQFTQGCFRIDSQKINHSIHVPSSIAIKKVLLPEFDYMLYARNIFRKVLLKDIDIKIIKDAFKFIKAYLNSIFNKKRYAYKLWILCAPSISNINRVMLEPDSNAIGQKRVRVHWESIDNLQKTILENINALSELSTLLSINKIEPNPQIFDNESISSLNGGAHHLCTTRMSTDKKFSVVDKNCKLNELENLYLTGSSVFSNSFPANSTFTSIALSFRLADHIKSIEKLNSSL